MADDPNKFSSESVKSLKDALSSKDSGAQQFSVNSNFANMLPKTSVPSNEMVGKLSDFLAGKDQGLPQISGVNSPVAPGKMNASRNEFVGSLGDALQKNESDNHGPNWVFARSASSSGCGCNQNSSAKAAPTTSIPKSRASSGNTRMDKIQSHLSEIIDQMTGLLVESPGVDPDGRLEEALRTIKTAIPPTR